MRKQPANSFERMTGAVTLSTAARKSGVPRREVRRLIQRGKLPFLQVRGQICVPREALERLGKPR
ncbi:MAG: excisionase family DNA-binding protein [Planctomycetales bacterium]|nr:excisionase family DNA-binding protein [Planctomycetales bacterium]